MVEVVKGKFSIVCYWKKATRTEWNEKEVPGTEG